MSGAEREKKGSGERIKINKKRPWGAIPESLVVDVRLSTTARIVAVWLCIRPPNWIVRREHLLASLGIGLDAWWRARRQLLQLGYLVEHKERRGGRFTSAGLEFFPDPEPATTQGFTEHGESELGLSGQGKAESLATTVSTPTKIPPQGNVVVVDEIAWPVGLADDQKQACGNALLPVKESRRQQLVDELAGRLLQSHGQPVTNPAGWLRNLVGRDLAGNVTLELAGGIAAARSAKLAAKRRDELPTFQQRGPVVSLAPPSAAQLAGRAAAREQLGRFKKTNATAVT